MDKLLFALAAAINSRASPLQMLAPIKYPGRQLQPQTLPDGLISVTAAKWGYEYKHRGRLPQTLPPPADTAQIRKALNTAIAPRYAVREVINQQKSITIIIIKIQEAKS